MEFLPVMMGAAVVMYGCRLAGFTVRLDRRFPQSEIFLHYLPISVLCALTVSSLLSEPASVGLKSISLVVSGILMWKTKHMGLAILSGLAIFWVLTV